MSSKKNEIDTYAQWTHLGWLIDFEMPPKENQLSNISATPDRVQGANETIEVELQFKSYDHTFTGELHQVVPDGQAMSEVIIGIAESAYSKMFPASWQKNETRPSGIVMTGVSDNGDKLIFNGTPTSNDTITVPDLVTKPKITVVITDKNASVTTTDKDLYFVTSGNVTIVPNDTYKFPDNTTLDSFTITPETMKKYMKLIKNDSGSVTINVNGVGYIDEMVNVSISAPPTLVKSAYRVEVSLGENITSSGGALVQDVEIGQPMTQINLAVDSTKVIASFFPDTHNISKDGVSVNTDTSTNKPYTKAWISGTPLRPTSISVPAPVNGYHVVVTGGANCTHVSGSLDQYVKSGDSIETVVFRCNEGYWFGKYNGGSNNTMSIKLNPEKTEITLSGRPASMDGFGDFDVKLEDAVPKPVALTVNLPSDGSVIVKPGEEANLNQSVASGENIQGITLLPKNANYKMTQDWRKTITVEPANEHISIVTTDTETHISGRISENSVITVPALEIIQAHDSYNWTIGGIGSELYYERGYNSTNTHELIETSSLTTYGGLSPTMFFWA